MCRLATTAMLIGIGAAATHAQPPPSTRTPSFRTTTHIVEVDVRLADRDGRFPTDLRKEDFIVLEDGVRQQIETLFLSGVPGISGAERNRPDPQTWILVFDDTHMQVAGLRRAKLAAQGFIRRLPGRDLAAVVYQGTLIGNRITAERTDMLAALASIQLPGEAPLGGGAWSDKLLAERQERDTLGTLEALARGLTTIRGPKSVVLFSDGFAFNNTLGALRSTIDRLNQAGARAYAIDTRGLAGEPSAALNSLAWDTGGRMIFNITKLDAALREVEADAAVYYVVGYQSRNVTFDGQFRRIEVRVAPPGIQVRARKGYLAIDPKLMRKPGT